MSVSSRSSTKTGLSSVFLGRNAAAFFLPLFTNRPNYKGKYENIS
jgi:hypothetical protein